MRMIDADRLIEWIMDISTKGRVLTVPDIRFITNEIAAHDSGWIPFVKRSLTDDEQKIHPEWCFILEGDAPEDEEEILLYRPWKNSKGYIITLDMYMNNGNECYLDGAGEIENGMFWMHLPEPPEEGTSNADG